MSNPPDAYEDQLAPIPPARTTGDKVTPLANAIRVELASMWRVIETLNAQPHTEYDGSLHALLTARLEDVGAKLSEMEALP